MFVLVGSEVKFDQWCRDHDINPRSKDVIWIRNADDISQLMGHELRLGRDEVVYLSDAIRIRDLGYISDGIQSRFRPPVR